MDAAARDELDALRRRAFGPDADINDDPDALARLIELEELARPRPPVSDVAAGDAASGDVDGADQEPPVSRSRAVAASERSAEPSRRRRAIIAVTAAAGAVVMGLVMLQPLTPVPRAPASSAAEGSPFLFTAETRSRTLMTLRIDASFGGYIRLPADNPVPEFPATSTLDWVVFLGDYYGWELWIAGGSGEANDQHCILIRRDDDVRARCDNPESQRIGTLRVSIAAADIAANDLPEPMIGRDRIRFQWVHNGSIELVLGMFGPD